MGSKYQLTQVENKAFYRMVLMLVIPMALQNLINVSVTTADVVMLGMVGEIELSGASLGGQVQYILNLIFFGFASGASVLTAQYWGKQDKDSIEKVFGMTLTFAMCFSIVFFGLAQLFPRELMSIFTSEEAVIEKGVEYLKIVSFSYLIVAITMNYLSLLKSVERVVISTVTYFCSLVFNIIANGILIFGLFGVPAMGVKGAAYATTMARILELIIVIFYAKSKRSPIRLRKKNFIKFEQLLLKDFFAFSGPVVMNELMWGLGMAANAAIIGHLGSPAVAANAVAQVIRQLLMVVAFGLSSATAIMLGKAIGEKKLDLAEAYAAKLWRLSVAVTVVISIGLYLCKDLIINSLTLSETAGEYLGFMIFVICYYVIFQAYNCTVIVGVFRAGGDTKIGLIIDVISMWGFSILLGYIAAFWLNWDVRAVYVLLLSDEIVKIFISVWRYRKKIWLRNVTREF